MNFWRNLSITKKLYSVVGLMAVLIACELVTLRFAMRTLSAVRAFVAGEGVWSKSQKNAIFYLQQYGLTKDVRSYELFLEQLKVPEGDHRARLALLESPPDLEVAKKGFLDGLMHPDDIESMTELLMRFRNISYISRALRAWESGDRLLSEVKETGVSFKRLLESKSTKSEDILNKINKINELNIQMTDLENEFSNALGEGSRWMEKSVLFLLFCAVVVVEAVGLTLTIKTTRMISGGLNDLNDVAKNMANGELVAALKVRSRDELGTLAFSVNRMSEAIRSSQDKLERRVQERTVELKAMADRNAQLYQEAIEAVQTREDFLSIATHELRTPLTSLHLQLQLLESMTHREDLVKGIASTGLIEKSFEQAKRLTRLLDELLDLTRLKKGALEISIEKANLSELVCDTISEFATEAAKKGCLLEVVSSTPVVGFFDPTRIRQVITNLISNAIKYGEGEPITVCVESNSQMGRIIVQDRGKGIPLEKHGTIFDRYERLANDRYATGLGLGLFISRQIVAAHGGNISVSSEEGAGARFLVEIPLNLERPKQA